jgi:hypothetical protein
MSVTLPITSGQSTVSEYAASNISINRQMLAVNGILEPSYTVNIGYNKQEYLLDANGNKIAVINTNTVGSIADSSSYGNITLTPSMVTTLFSTIPASGVSLGNEIASQADSLIHADLVSRGILTV